ncbi:hypothetical protein [Diatraea saccharalis granulovirus]|uniref:Uncharacterized protein n=1 Tax=Diatraea saccharalis granulovirus TaxID=1675862 RepID=A0A0R7EYY5_9BBAC|nr:hypothetical protein [Diatraea saccharalis granulovirus]AKN80794.1 hypothetical protein [Diatraea saccharalis granulovirus]
MTRSEVISNLFKSTPKSLYWLAVEAVAREINEKCDEYDLEKLPKVVANLKESLQLPNTVFNDVLFQHFPCFIYCSDYFVMKKQCGKCKFVVDDNLRKEYFLYEMFCEKCNNEMFTLIDPHEHEWDDIDHNDDNFVLEFFYNGDLNY